MKPNFDQNWTTTNGGVPLNDSEVERYIRVVPRPNQVHLAQQPFYCFMHFGMNTANQREWGSGKETVQDFTIKKIKPEQWVRTVKAAGASGIILTCKHHDGFCLWPSEYTSFSVKNTDFDGDIVKQVSDACAAGGLDFGVYLSPWDMHEPTYGTPDYNDYFCNQLTELLTNYGHISEVWFDGAKGADVPNFEFDWARYYALIRKLQPDALMSMARDLIWYPAEVDVSIRKGWFWSKNEDRTVKSARRLFKLYLGSVGNNCTLLLNVPPTNKGVIHPRDARALKGMGQAIRKMTEHPIITYQLGELQPEQGYIDFDFDSVHKLKYVILSEEIRKSQRVEAFELWAKKPNGKMKRIYKGTVIGMKKIVRLRRGLNCLGVRLVIRQSRSTPDIAEIGFYE